MADSESAALTGLGDTPVLGAVGETRTLMTLATATSRLRVYQFRHDRISNFPRSPFDLRENEIILMFSKNTSLFFLLDTSEKKQPPKQCLGPKLPEILVI